MKAQIGRVTLTLSESMDDITAEKFHQFNRYATIDAEIGADADAINRHIDRIARYLNLGQNDRAVTELYQMRQAMTFVIQGVHPGLNAFIPLIEEIDGQHLPMQTDEAATELLHLLGGEGLTVGKIKAITGEFKKKAPNKWKHTFLS